MTMSLDDQVDLIVITHNNYLPIGRQTRQSAMNVIKDWFIMREKAREGDFEAQQWLENATLAGAHLDLANHEKPYYDHWAIAWNAIQGMYIREVSRAQTPQEAATEAINRLASAVEPKSFLRRLLGK